jgi:hypothetical protein
MPPSIRAPARLASDFHLIDGSANLPLQDHRLHPLSQVLLVCGACAWARGYSPDRIIDRLRELRAGGYKTPIKAVAGHVRWACPACGRRQWATVLAYPVGIDPAEVRRMANVYRN